MIPGRNPVFLYPQWNDKTIFYVENIHVYQCHPILTIYSTGKND